MKMEKVKNVCAKVKIFREKYLISLYLCCSTKRMGLLVTLCSVLLCSVLLSSLFHLSVTVEMLGIISLRYFLLSSMGCKTVKQFQEAMSHHSEMKWKISSKCVLFLEWENLIFKNIDISGGSRFPHFVYCLLCVLSSIQLVIMWKQEIKVECTHWDYP